MRLRSPTVPTSGAVEHAGIYCQHPGNNQLSGGFRLLSGWPAIWQLHCYSNHIVAYVRSISGPAVEKPPQDNQILQADSFSYRILCVNAPVATDTNVFNLSFSDPRYLYSQQLAANLHELRLTFLWPQNPNGNLGTGRQTFRTLVAGQVATRHHRRQLSCIFTSRNRSPSPSENKFPVDKLPKLQVTSAGSRPADLVIRHPSFVIRCAFTLVEVMVVMALLSLIVIALMGVFSSTQAAFRASVTQTDVLEGGRAAMDLIAGDLRAMTPSLGADQCFWQRKQFRAIWRTTARSR